MKTKRTIKELTTMLDCDEEDLEVFLDTQYDIDEIIDNMESKHICIEDIVDEIVFKGMEELERRLSEKREYIINDVKDKTLNQMNMYVQENDMIDCYDAEMLMDYCKYYDMLKHDYMKPAGQYVIYYDDFSDYPIVKIEHESFYSEFMSNDYDEIKGLMGFVTEDWDDEDEY